MISDDDEINEDPWLKLNELYKINALLDEFLDKIWKLATARNRKIDKKINIDKYLEIDKYVDEYTDITDGKIDLFNNLGSILTKAAVEIQNKAYIINDLKQKENLDIKTLKTMHETLEKVLIKWMKTISSTIKNDKISKYDMKPCRPSSKEDVKPDTDKDMKPDTDKDIKPNRPVNERESNTKKVTKKDVKLDIKHDIVRLDDKTKTNESQKTKTPQKTFINNESHLKKLVNNIKIILEYFVCEKFINEKFPTLRVSKDVILLHSKYEPK